MKRRIRFVLMMLLMLTYSIVASAYITLAPSQVSVNVGEQEFLSVPDVYQGYIDHAVWACSNPNVRFVQKDSAGAIIEVSAHFSGIAIVELVCVEKYVDNKGITRANTYYKEFRITCNGTSGGSGGTLTSISFPAMTLKVGDIIIVKPNVVPADAEITYSSVSISDGYADVARIFVHQNQLKVIAASPGTETARVTMSSGVSASITVKVTAPVTPSQIQDTQDNAVHDTHLSGAVKKMEALFGNVLGFKNK